MVRQNRLESLDSVTEADVVRTFNQRQQFHRGPP